MCNGPMPARSSPSRRSAVFIIVTSAGLPERAYGYQTRPHDFSDCFGTTPPRCAQATRSEISAEPLMRPARKSRPKQADSETGPNPSPGSSLPRLNLREPQGKNLIIPEDKLAEHFLISGSTG